MINNYYSRAQLAVDIVKNPLALKVLLELYPLKKYNAEFIANKFSIELSSVVSIFDLLDTNGMIKDNPTSGKKILTVEGKQFLEQTSAVFPELKLFLDELKEQPVIS